MKNTDVLVAVMLCAVSVSGCASTGKTTKTVSATTVSQPTTTVVRHDGNGVTTTETQTQPGVLQNSTTTTEIKEKHPGFIVATFRAIGHVIALPFVLLGGLFRAIFGG